jgi:hypothetical protein
MKEILKKAKQEMKMTGGFKKFEKAEPINFEE